MVTYQNCDSNSIPAGSTKATNLTPNQFHKLCPGVPSSSSSSSSQSLQYPQCGDGTSFSFYYSRPTQRKQNINKLLIEFVGGGACWDGTTCQIQESYLTFPSDKLDAFIGLSCTEIQAGVENQNQAINMLCANSDVGGVDFTSYNTIVVPYCTQDVFVGSNRGVQYDDGSTVNHVGAANTLSVLKWVYRNFPNPSHIVLTGCSAGGTAVPIAYDLLNMHYNRWTRSPPGMKSVQISVLADSAVYLTPNYFLEYGLPNWDPSPIMKKIRFPYSKYNSDEDYSTLVWEHVLRRGPNSDQWGFITHNDDPVSQTYYEYMGGQYDGAYYNDNDDDDQAQGQRMLSNDNNNDENLAEEWWDSLSSSISYVQSRHSNVDTYVIDGEGHCTFGLYYAIQESSSNNGSFDDWAKSILEEKIVLGRPRHAFALFTTSIVLGTLVVFGAMYGNTGGSGGSVNTRGRRRKVIDMDDGDGILLTNTQRDSTQNTSTDATSTDNMLFLSPIQKTNVSHSTSDETEIGKKNSLYFLLLQAIHHVIAWIQTLVVATASHLRRYFEDYPITAGYLIVVTFYFWTMILSIGISGFAHPIDNPSLGPTAVTLSNFGINNPSLIVYKIQFFRLVTSGFLCSGIITYGITVICLWTQTRYIEMAFGSSNTKQFVTSLFTILLGCNLIYACFSINGGATCSTIAIIIGLNVQSILLARNHNNQQQQQQVKSDSPVATPPDITPASSFPRPICSTITIFILVSILFPFNSWLVMVGGGFIGVLMGAFGFNNNGRQSVDTTASTTDPSSSSSPSSSPMMQKSRPMIPFWYIYVIMFFVLVFRIRKPKQLYESPFLTGCDLAFVVLPADVAGSLYDGDNQNDERRRELQYLRRWLAEDGDDNQGDDDEDTICAEFCVPHIASRLLLWGAKRYSGYSVQEGQCEDNGYSTHIADKSFAKATYSVDVEVYSSAYYNDDDE